MSERYRWRGINPAGTFSSGVMMLGAAKLAALVESRFAAGWRSLVICSGAGPVPPPAIGAADVVAEITKHPQTGRRVWWSE